MKKNIYAHSILSLILNDLGQKINYEHKYADTDKVVFHDGAHHGYICGLDDACGIIQKYQKRIRNKPLTKEV